MAETSREIRLASRPEGEPTPEDFELAEVPVPEPGEGEILVRNEYLSVDPYMRGRMRDVKSYMPPFEVGEVMTGGAVGQVVASNGGVRRGLVGPGPERLARALRVRRRGPVPGRPGRGAGLDLARRARDAGLTAYAGLMRIGKPQEGETLFVSGAAGAVGSAVGQMPAGGLRAVGSAGSPEKVEWLTGELGSTPRSTTATATSARSCASTAPKGSTSTSTTSEATTSARRSAGWNVGADPPVRRDLPVQRGAAARARATSSRCSPSG